MSLTLSIPRPTFTRRELLKADNLTLGVLLLLALFFGYMAFKPARFDETGNEQDLVAKLAKTESTVKRKAADGLAWAMADDDSKLYAGDQIFTESSSTATVRFDDGSEITVAENSLIKIEKKGGKTTIDMSKGFVSGKLEGGSGLTLKMGNTKVALEKGAEIQVKVDPNDKNATKVSLLKGDATIEAGTEKLELKKDQVLSVGAGGAKVSEIALKPVLPSAGKRVDADESPTIFFTWESSKTMPYRLVVARDTSFRDVVATETTSEKAATLPAPGPGQYYWKVTGKDPATGKIEESVNVPFSVFKTLAPELIAPAAGRRFTIAKSGRDGEVISFLWRAPEPGDGYEIQVAKSRDFKDPVVNRKTQQSQLDIRDLDPGSYFWRVRVVGKEGGKGSRYSAASDFAIDRTEAPPAPTLLKPESGARKTPGQLLSFEWREVPGADGYQIEVLSEGKAVVSEKVKGSSHTWSPKDAGRYLWRVRSQDKFGRDTIFSQARELNVDARTPTLVLPADRDTFSLAQKKMQVDFSWTQVDGAAQYEIEIAKDPDFKSGAIRRKVPGNEHQWTVDKSGIYYWRVRAKAPGVDNPPFSPSRQLTIKELELLPPPRLLDRYYFRLPPPLLDLSWMPPAPAPEPTRRYRAASLGERAVSAAVSLLDLLTGTTVARAQSVVTVNGPVDIKWEPVQGAAGYEVEVSREAKFSRSLLKRKLTGPRFLWPEAKPGRYFLRATSVDELNRPGPFSRVAELIVTYQPPKLLSPPDEAQLTLEAGARDVPLVWQASSAAKRYTVEVSQTADFAKPLLSRQLEGGKGRFVATLDPGSYVWRVVARYGDGQPDPPSEPFRFTVKGSALAPPVLRSPPDQSVLKHEDKTLAVGFTWAKVTGAKGYDVEVSTTPDFAELTVNERIDEAAKLDRELPDGIYYWRVRGRAGAKAFGTYSSVWSFRVKTIPSVPEWLRPDEGTALTYLTQEPPDVALAWKAANGAATYDLELSRNPEFKRKAVALNTAEASSAQRLKDGQYYARVRSRAEDGEISAWSNVRSFSQARQLPDAPELIYPEDGQKVIKKKVLRLTWNENEGFKGYRLVVAKDRKFKTIVKEQTLEDTEEPLENLPNGKYYWYVEGRNEEAKLALKSDVQMFNIAPPPDLGRPEKLRLQAGYAPSIISNTMVSPTITNSLSIAALNSFTLDGSYWLSGSFGLAGAYHRKSAELYGDSDKLSGSEDQKPLEYIPQHTAFLTRYRIFLGKPGKSLELHARVGYIYKSFYTYYPQSRTALGLTETGAHNLQAGLGAKIPFNPQESLESFFDYGKAIASSPAKITGGSNMLFDLGYHRNLVDRLGFGLGYRYGRASYDFVESQHGIVGTLQEVTHSVMGAFEYGF
jgi:hypothetical protein